ncbi:MAG: alpha/beta hydrolase [Bacteroidetes bacterium]|nr:alpha/beta hydrolase [Bacteroidota bacterium]
MKRIRLILLLLVSSFVIQAQEIIPLYKGLPPGNKKSGNTESIIKTGRGYVTNVSIPTITVFKPQKINAAKTAVIICPGGGYFRLSIFDGGYELAKELNKEGITAFVLKYRTYTENAFESFQTIPFQDLQTTFKIVQEGADNFGIDKNNIGIIGLSAGGHLCAMTAIAKEGIKPKFTLLIYPVISFMDELTSAKSVTKQNLLGNQITQEQKMTFSPEIHVTSTTAPAFLVHAQDDSTSLVGNSIAYYSALVKYKVPAQLLIYQKGGHGFAMYNKEQDEYWLPAAIKWMRLNNFLKP